jgi:hypothetical protein
MLIMNDRFLVFGRRKTEEEAYTRKEVLMCDSAPKL